MMFPGAVPIMAVCLAALTLAAAVSFALVFATIVQYVLSAVGERTERMKRLNTGAPGKIPVWAKMYVTFPVAFWVFMIILVYALAGPYLIVVSYLSKL